MPKETSFYFSHDYNARNDRKIAALVRDYKAAGYGIYWCTVEMMHEEGGELEFDDITFSAIGKDLNEANEAVLQVLQDCINKYKLFFFVENSLTANRVKQNLGDREAKKGIKQLAGKLGGINSGLSRRNKTQSKQNEAVLQIDEAEVKQNEAMLHKTKQRKGKERKGNNNKESDKENFPTFPIATDLNGLPEIKIGSVIQLFGITKHIDLLNDDVIGMWEVFKVQNVTGKKYYSDKDAVYSHFINWVKDIKFEKQNGKNQMVY